MRTFDVPTILLSKANFEATLSGARRAHVIADVIGKPETHDVVRFAMIDSPNGPSIYARITFVEELPRSVDTGKPSILLSYEPRVTSRMPAIRLPEDA